MEWVKQVEHRRPFQAYILSGLAYCHLKFAVCRIHACTWRATGWCVWQNWSYI